MLMIRFADDRQAALSIGYEATDWNTKPVFRDYTDALSDWTVRLMVKDGKAIGALYTKGPEFHVSVLPSWRGRWATRGVLNAIIAKPISITRVTPGHERVNGLLERLGFEHRGDGLFVKETHHGH
jgi:hypothetical protein